MAGIETLEADSRGLLQEAIRRSLVLLVVILPLLAVCWQVSEQLPIGGLTLGIYVAVAVLLILCEHALAFDRGWGSAVRGSRTDFLYVILATAMDKASFVLCAGAVAALGRDLAAFFHTDLWPSHWSFGFQVLAALLIADAATYFRHRLFHWSPLLWRFHRIHHSVTGLYWIRSAYTHPVEQFFIMMAIMFPIAFLGAADQILAVVAFVYGLSGLLQHANIDSRSSLLNFVFATPEVHRIHHTADERGNRSNFSAFFVLMDLLFRTYRRPERSPAPVRLGLEGVATFPGDFLTHLVMPFRRDPVGIRLDDEWVKKETGIPTANEP